MPIWKRRIWFSTIAVKSSYNRTYRGSLSIEETIWNRLPLFICVYSHVQINDSLFLAEECVYIQHNKKYILTETFKDHRQNKKQIRYKNTWSWYSLFNRKTLLSIFSDDNQEIHKERVTTILISTIDEFRIVQALNFLPCWS
jgi:hypothetical protein